MKEAKQLLKKYMEMSKKSEYVSIAQIVNDLHWLIQDFRIKRLPKDQR